MVKLGEYIDSISKYDSSNHGTITEWLIELSKVVEAICVKIDLDRSILNYPVRDVEDGPLR